MKNILLAGAIIDFYVNRKRFEAYKTEVGRMNYVYAMLTKYTDKLKNHVLILGETAVEIRDVSITSNNFWGMDDICTPPDLKYSAGNEVPALPDDSKNIPVRIFMMDIVATMEDEPENNSDLFFEIEEDDFYLQVSNYRIV